MKLKTHGRYVYSALPERKDYSWPGGKRLAVHLCLNVEHFSFGEGLGNDYAAPQLWSCTASSSASRTGCAASGG